MICNDVKNLLSLFLDNEIDEQDKQRVEAHLSICTDCTGEMHELENLKRLCGGLPEITPPLSLSQRVLAGTENFKLKPIHIEIPYWLKDWRIYGGAAAAVFAVFLISGPILSTYKTVSETRNDLPKAAVSTPQATSVPVDNGIGKEFASNEEKTPVPATLSAADKPKETQAPASDTSVSLKVEAQPSSAPAPQPQMPYGAETAAYSAADAVETAAPMPEANQPENTEDMGAVSAASQPSSTLQPSMKSAKAFGGGASSAPVASPAASAPAENKVLYIYINSSNKEEFFKWLSSNLSLAGAGVAVNGKMLYKVSQSQYDAIVQYTQKNSIKTAEGNDDDINAAIVSTDGESEGIYIVVTEEAN